MIFRLILLVLFSIASCFTVTATAFMGRVDILYLILFQCVLGGAAIGSTLKKG